MTSWQQDIQRQIAYLQGGRHAPQSCNAIADTMQALLDVAVAAEAIDDVQGYDGYYREYAEALGEALAKLEAMSDG